ncbi:MAG: hypothetical protein DMG21_19130 [Acidobacteria bacterium]|nr:MAG: hypothetical protein DMG21_19130 [Acidobacteriota bacterium]
MAFGATARRTNLQTDPTHQATAAPPGSSGLTAQVVASEADFRSLRDDWNALASSSKFQNVFASFDWAWGWWHHVGRDESILGQKSLFIVVVRTRDRVVGIAPLMIRKPSRQGLSVRKLEFIGSTFNDYNDFLLGESQPAVLGALARFMIENEHFWDIVDFRSFPNSSPSPGILRETFAEFALPHRLAPDDPCPYVPITTDWEGVLKTLPYDTRSTFRKKAHRLQRLKDQGLRMRIIEHPQDETELVARMAEVEERKRVHGLAGNRFVRATRGFFEYLFKALGPAGCLSVAVMEQGDRLVAYRLGFRVGRKIWDYTTAFDPALGKLSPGTMLIPQLIDYAFQKGFEELDFLRGDEPYKRRFAKSAHTTWRVMAWKREAASRWKAFMYFRLRPFLYRQRWASLLGLPYAPHGEV